jgi:hypothetical protein
VELDTIRAERNQLRGLLADQVQLRAQLVDSQAQRVAVETERQQTRQELIDLKRAPFTTRAFRRHQSGQAARSSSGPPWQ